MVCLAGRALIAFAGLFGLALVTLAPWSPAPGTWVVDFEPADEGRLRGRFLSEAHSGKSASHHHHAATSTALYAVNAATDREREVVASARQTGFIVPEWKPRCNVNRTNFVPSCLPEQIYERKNIDDWTFAEYCGVTYAAVRVANQKTKGDIHAKVYALMFDNLVMTCLHYIGGMALTGILLKKPKEEQQQHKETQASCMDRMKDMLYLCTAVGAAAYAFTTSSLSMSKFWMQASQYFHGVWMLPTSPTSDHCRAILFQEFLYYGDILGYLTLSAFTVMDGLLVCLPLLMWLGFTSNVCCTAWVCIPFAKLMSAIWTCLVSCITCLPFAKLMSAVWTCLVSCITCKWVPAFCSALKYLLCFGWLEDLFWTCCSLAKVWCGTLAPAFHWILCECGILQMMRHCCLGCWNQCCLNFWKGWFYFHHCSCLCCINFLFHDPCTIASTLGITLVAALVFIFCLFPLAIYLGVGMMAFFGAVLLTVLILLAPILLVFWLVTQLVVCVMWVKAKVLKEEAPEFMRLCEYYAVYYGELQRQFQESLEWIGMVGKAWSTMEKRVKEVSETHRTLPAQVAATVARAELFSGDSRALGLCVPTVLVLLLVSGSSIMAGSTSSLMRLSGRHDFAWAACSKEDGTPTFCVEHTFFDDLRTMTHEDLVTTSGVKVPPTWPVLDGCVCLECDGSTVVANVDRHTVCGPRELPRPWEESFACAAHADGDVRQESRRLGSVYADKLKQNASEVIKPNGRGDGGLVLEGMHQYLGGGVKVHPQLLNTYRMEVEHPPRRGCYGLSLPAVSLLVETQRKNGWCNCSSQKFVPTAIDSVFVAPTIDLPGYDFGLLPSLLKASIKVGSYKKLRGHAMLTAASKVHPMWQKEAVADQKLEVEEWMSTYGADPHVGIQMSIVSGFVSSWRGMAGSITELLRDLFVDTFYGYYKLLTTRTLETLRWLIGEFYTLKNFVGALTDWLKTGSEMDFKECQEVVLCGRSMASLMAGIATATTVFKMKGVYTPLSQ